MKLSNDDKNKIERAVLEAEKTTNGEIVPVIVKISDHYSVAGPRAALLIAMLTMVVGYYTHLMDDNLLLYMTLIFLSALIGQLLATFVYAFKRMFLLKSEIEEEFTQKAIQTFVMQGVTETRERNGILLYLSAFERKAIILADSGINSKLSPETWNDIIQKLIPLMKEKRYAEGIIGAIKQIGEILTEHFPADSQDQDELPNKIIIEID